MTSQSDRGSSEFRRGAADYSTPSTCFKPTATAADARRFDDSNEQKAFPYDSLYSEPYQPYSPPDRYLWRPSPSKASRSNWKDTVGSWYLADGAPLDVNCGLFSPTSQRAELFSGDLDPEPFDASGETERLLKIHYLAEELVAREAAMAATNDDVVSKEVDPRTCAATEPADPVKLPASFPSMSLKTLAESSLMPLAEAADTSVRVSVNKAPSEESTPADSSQASREQLQTEPTGTWPSTSDVLAGAGSSYGYPGGRRKKAVPRKSPTADDPNFKGAVVHMRLQMVHGEPRLKMEHYYNNMQRRGVLRPDYAEISESEDDFEFARKEDVEHQDKQCASCATKLTPLWRDAEDGTPLCNACGIRYKKYKVRCTRCWHIPRKNDNTRSDCKECGGTLRFVVRKSVN